MLSLGEVDSSGLCCLRWQVFDTELFRKVKLSKFRKQVFAKTDGHCFYCGTKLGEKGWQEDHFHPVIRVGGKMLYPELDVLDNLVPSCAPCNNYKTSYPIEVYREVIQAAFKSVPKQSTRSNLSAFIILRLLSVSTKTVSRMLR